MADDNSGNRGDDDPHPRVEEAFEERHAVEEEDEREEEEEEEEEEDEDEDFGENDERTALFALVLGPLDDGRMRTRLKGPKTSKELCQPIQSSSH